MDRLRWGLLQIFREARFALVAATVSLVSCSGLTSCSGGDGSSGHGIEAPERDYYLPYGVGADAIAAVDAGDFNRTISIASSGVSRAVLVREVPVTGTQGRSASPYAIWYLTNGQWNRVWLVKSKSQIAEAFGPAIATLCSAEIIYPDLAQPEGSVLRYSEPGLGGTCNNDVYSTLLTSNGAQSSLAFQGRIVSQLHDAAGKLNGFVVLTGSQLKTVAYPSAAESVLLDPVPPTSVTALERVPNGVWIEFGTDWRLATLDSGLSPVRYSLSAGFQAPTSQGRDSKYLYQLEVASNGGSPSRLWRIALDGSTAAELILDSNEHFDYLLNTEGRIWLTRAAPAPQKLWWIDQANTANGLHVAETLNDGAVGFWPGTDRIFHNESDLATNTYTIKITKDDGSTPVSAANSQFRFCAQDYPDFFSVTGRAPINNIVVNESADQSVSSGGRLKVYNQQTFTAKLLYTFDRQTTINAFSYGPLGLGQYFYLDSSGHSNGPDLFAFDLDSGRFRFLPETTAVETPMN